MRQLVSGLLRTKLSSTYARKASIQSSFPVRPGEVVMVGDALTADGDWTGAFPGAPIRNRGLAGETTESMLARLGEITAGSPASIFLMLGTNDVAAGVPGSAVVNNLRTAVDRVRQDSPATRLVLQSLLPRDDRINGRVTETNLGIRRLAFDHGVTYVDLHHDFADHRGRLRSDLTADGVTINGKGYVLWRDRLQSAMHEFVPNAGELVIDLTKPVATASIRPVSGPTPPPPTPQPSAQPASANAPEPSKALSN